jgi:hypothetical protein
MRQERKDLPMKHSPRFWPLAPMWGIALLCGMLGLPGCQQAAPDQELVNVSYDPTR